MKKLEIGKGELRFREIALAIGIFDDRWLKENRGLGYYPIYFDLNREVTLEFREWLDDTERSLKHEGGGINLLPFFEERFGGYSAEDIMLPMTYHRLNKDLDSVEGLREAIEMEANDALMKKIDASWEEIKEVTLLMVDDLWEERRP